MSADGNNQAGETAVVIARIAKARGIKGEVACDLETDFPERFASMNTLLVKLPNGTVSELRLEEHWFHNNRVVLKFEGYDTMTQAEQLVGGLVVISEQDPELLADGEFYETKIVGSKVVTVGGESVGNVIKIMRTGGTDLLVVQGDEGREHLIPFADDICLTVGEGRIVVSLPDGLLDL